MSSEESLIEDSNDDLGSDSDREGSRTVTKKRLVKHKLLWRSSECERAMQSLDRKLDRCRNAKGKTMCLDIQEGGPSSR